MRLKAVVRPDGASTSGIATELFAYAEAGRTVVQLPSRNGLPGEVLLVPTDRLESA
jgi:hypothetical protein